MFQCIKDNNLGLTQFFKDCKSCIGHQFVSTISQARRLRGSCQGDLKRRGDEASRHVIERGYIVERTMLKPCEETSFDVEW